MSLKDIIKKEASDGSLKVEEEPKFEAYHTTITNQARIANEAISNAQNLATIKSTLMMFFDKIK